MALFGLIATGDAFKTEMAFIIVKQTNKMIFIFKIFNLLLFIN